MRKYRKGTHCDLTLHMYHPSQRVSNELRRINQILNFTDTMFALINGAFVIARIN